MIGVEQIGAVHASAPRARWGRPGRPGAVLHARGAWLCATAAVQPLPGADRRARVPDRGDRARNERAVLVLGGGRSIQLLGPLGTGFELNVDRPLLVGGGIGIAPLPYLSEALGRPRALLGFRSLGTRRPLRSSRMPRWPWSRRSSPSSCPINQVTCSPAGPSRCSRRSRARARRATCVGGADGLRVRRLYGCVVEVDGHMKRLCVEGPVLIAA